MIVAVGCLSMDSQSVHDMLVSFSVFTCILFFLFFLLVGAGARAARCGSTAVGAAMCGYVKNDAAAGTGCLPSGRVS